MSTIQQFNVFGIIENCVHFITDLYAVPKVVKIGVARLCFEYLKTLQTPPCGSLKRENNMSDNAMNKGGRQALPEYKKKTVGVMVRFSPVDMIYLRACADECGLRVAEYIRRAAMNQETTRLLSKEEMTAVSEIRNVGNNLNQITKSMHLGASVDKEIRDILAFITGVIRKIR